MATIRSEEAHAAQILDELALHVPISEAKEPDLLALLARAVGEARDDEAQYMLAKLEQLKDEPIEPLLSYGSVSQDWAAIKRWFGRLVRRRQDPPQE